MRFDIALHRASSPRLRPTGPLGFGKYFTDHMFLMDFEAGKGWHSPRLMPYGPLPMDPAAAAIHYGQAVFEGLKAFRCEDGKVRLFRPQAHAQRLNASSARLVMPAVEEAHLVEALRALVHLDREWVPSESGAALYLRPFVIATEGFLGVRPASRYLCAIIASPVGQYYGGASGTLRIWVEQEYVRAVRGGTGAAKAAANYAGSLLAAEHAKARGYDQVLWLDGVERRYVEEVGTMNLFVVLGGKVITPPLEGTLLGGITRETVLTLCDELGLPVEQRPLSIDEVLRAAEKGTLTEVFGTGTASGVAPVGELGFKARRLEVNGGRVGPIARRLSAALQEAQRGAGADARGWRLEV